MNRLWSWVARKAGLHQLAQDSSTQLDAVQAQLAGCRGRLDALEAAIAQEKARGAEFIANANELFGQYGRALTNHKGALEAHEMRLDAGERTYKRMTPHEQGVLRRMALRKKKPGVLGQVADPVDPKAGES